MFINKSTDTKEIIIFASSFLFKNASCYDKKKSPRFFLRGVNNWSVDAPKNIDVVRNIKVISINL